MKKRILPMLLCMSMVVTLFTGCGSKNTSTENTNTTNESVVVQEEQEENQNENSDLITEDNQTEETNITSNDVSFWDDMKILVDGYEVVLGKTTAQDLVDQGWSYIQQNYSEGGQIHRDYGDNFYFSTHETRSKKGDLSEFVIDAFTIYEGDIYNVDVGSIGGITADATPQDILETLGIPDYFSNMEAREDSYYIWIYYSENNNMGITINYATINPEDEDFTISIGKGEPSAVREEIAELEEYCQNNIDYAKGEDVFKATYPELFEEEIVADNSTNSAYAISIDGHTLYFGETTVEEMMQMFGDYTIEPENLFYFNDTGDAACYKFKIVKDENECWEFVCQDVDTKYTNVSTIELEGKEPEIDVSKLPLKTVWAYHNGLYDSIFQLTSGEELVVDIDSIKTNCSVNGIYMGMTENEFLTLYPDAAPHQDIGRFIWYNFKDEETNMTYAVEFHRNQFNDNHERRCTEMSVEIHPSSN